MTLDFKLCPMTIDHWEMEMLTCGHHRLQLVVPVHGVIGNSVATSEAGRKKRIDWMETVAKHVSHARKTACWEPDGEYLLTVGFSFHKPTHGNQKLDIENYLKPTLDAVAAGLFCKREADLASIKKWNYDDSCFHHLLINRLPDAKTKEEEGIALFVTCDEHLNVTSAL